MTFPAPRPGLVIRYSFLWSREARSGASEGRKDRPCAIVLAVPRDAFDDVRVAVVPVTHTPPEDPATAIPLPAAVKASLGLDAADFTLLLSAGRSTDFQKPLLTHEIAIPSKYSPPDGSTQRAIPCPITES